MTQVLLVANTNFLTVGCFPNFPTKQTKTNVVVKRFFIHVIFYFSYVTSLHKCQSSSSYVDLSFICTHYIKKSIIMCLEIPVVEGFLLYSSSPHFQPPLAPLQLVFFLLFFLLNKRIYWTRHLYQSSGRALDICKALRLYSSRRTQPTGHIQSMVKEE